MKIPPDLDQNPPLGQVPPEFDPNDPNLQLVTKRRSKAPLVVAGVVVAGVVGFSVYRSVERQEQRKLHAAFMQAYSDFEKDEVKGKFWSCLLGNNIDPAAIADNLVLGARIEGAFAADPKGFPARVREECTPKALDAKNKVEALPAPALYADALKKYSEGLKELAHELDEWTRVAPQIIAEREVGKKMSSAATAWHAYDGSKPSNEVIAYDRFLHCAVPGIDKMKNGQALVEFLFNECKKPAYVIRLDSECGKELTSEPPGAPSSGPTFKQTLAKFAMDDREQSAFDDCLRKARKGKKRDDFAGVGKAWIAYMEAGNEIRRMGKEQLKED